MQADRPAGDPHITLDLRDVPLSKVLRYLTELAGMKFRYDATAVTIISLERQAEETKKKVDELKERTLVLKKGG